MISSENLQPWVFLSNPEVGCGPSVMFRGPCKPEPTTCMTRRAENVKKPTIARRTADPGELVVCVHLYHVALRTVKDKTSSTLPLQTLLSDATDPKRGPKGTAESWPEEQCRPSAEIWTINWQLFPDTKRCEQAAEQITDYRIGNSNLFPFSAPIHLKHRLNVEILLIQSHLNSRVSKLVKPLEFQRSKWPSTMTRVHAYQYWLDGTWTLDWNVNDVNMELREACASCGSN